MIELSLPSTLLTGFCNADQTSDIDSVYATHYILSSISARSDGDFGWSLQMAIDSVEILMEE